MTHAPSGLDEFTTPETLIREEVSARILALAATHPHWQGNNPTTGFSVERHLHGTHWDGCWTSHPECALRWAAAIARGDA